MYKLINSKVVIAKTYDLFNIDYSDWENRVPNWIEEALQDMQIHIQSEIVSEERTVVDGKIQLPCDIKLLNKVVHGDVDLYPTELYNLEAMSDIQKLYFFDRYRIDGNGYLSVPIDDDEVVTIYYYRTPVEKDEVTNLYFPLIPDREDLYMALAYYCLYRIVLRGHKVGKWTLEAPDYRLNPMLAYEKKKGKARIAVSNMDQNFARDLSNLKKTFNID